VHERCPVLYGRARHALCCDVLSWAGLSCRGGRWPDRYCTALFDAEIEDALLLNAPSELPNLGRRRAQRWHSNQCSGWQRYGETLCVHRTRAGRRQEKLLLLGRQRWAASVKASKNGRYLTYHATTRCIHLRQRRAMPFRCHAMPCSTRLGVVPARHPRPPPPPTRPGLTRRGLRQLTPTLLLLPAATTANHRLHRIPNVLHVQTPSHHHHHLAQCVCECVQAASSQP
jgi:hypothetical protein